MLTWFTGLFRFKITWVVLGVALVIFMILYVLDSYRDLVRNNARLAAELRSVQNTMDVVTADRDSAILAWRDRYRQLENVLEHTRAAREKAYAERERISRDLVAVKDWVDRATADPDSTTRDINTDVMRLDCLYDAVTGYGGDKECPQAAGADKTAATRADEEPVDTRGGFDTRYGPAPSFGGHVLFSDPRRQRAAA